MFNLLKSLNVQIFIAQINDSVTRTFFLTRPLIINNLTEIAIHCNRYVTYQITLSAVTAWLQKQFIPDALSNYITLEKTFAIYRVYIFRKIYRAMNTYTAINGAQLFVNGNAKDTFSSIKEPADAALKISLEPERSSILHIALFQRFNNADLQRP